MIGDYERAKELIIDPRLKTIFIDKYGEESHIYADGKCYPMEEFTGAGLWIAWMNEEEHKEWPIGAWAQFENGAANGEGVVLDCFYYREDYYASHAYTWYVGQFADGLANGQGEYLDEYFGESGIESSTKLKGEFQEGQIYSGTVEGVGDGANAPDISYVIQDGKLVKKVERCV